MRLTKYEPNENSMFPYKLKDDELSTELDSVHKLGQLEDIEELCIKITTQPVYEKLPNAKINKFDFTEYNSAYDFENKCIIVYKGSSAIVFFIKDYGKTWAMTKEELL